MAGELGVENLNFVQGVPEIKRRKKGGGVGELNTGGRGVGGPDPPVLHHYSKGKYSQWKVSSQGLPGQELAVFISIQWIALWSYFRFIIDEWETLHYIFLNNLVKV